MLVTVELELDDNDLRTIARDMSRPGLASTDDIQWWVRGTVLAGLVEARQDHHRRDLRETEQQRRNP